MPVLVHKKTKLKTENSGAKVVKEEATKAQTVKNWFTALKKKYSDRIPDYLMIPFGI